MAVLVFVGIGRSVHGHLVDLSGMASTAWPFASGLALGWVGSRGWRRPGALWPTGVAAWLATVAGGMVLRQVSGQGIAAAFVAVAAAFLGLFLLGWRVALRALAPPARRRADSRTGAR